MGFRLVVRWCLERCSSVRVLMAVSAFDGLRHEMENTIYTLQYGMQILSALLQTLQRNVQCTMDIQYTGTQGDIG